MTRISISLILEAFPPLHLRKDEMLEFCLSQVQLKTSKSCRERNLSVRASLTPGTRPVSDTELASLPAEVQAQALLATRSFTCQSSSSSIHSDPSHWAHNYEVETPQTVGLHAEACTDAESLGAFAPRSRFSQWPDKPP